MLKYKTVGVLILSNDVFQTYSSISMQLIGGIEKALAARGVNMIFSRVFETGQLPPAVLDGRVDGLILSGTLLPQENIYEKIRRLPSVWLSSHRNEGGDILLGGNEQTGEIAARYLLDRGHKKLGVVNAFVGHPGVVQRSMFFKMYAENAGAASVEMFTAQGGSHESSNLTSFKAVLAELVDRLVGSPSLPTGLFVPVDMQMAMVYDLLNARNIRPGRDVEIIGCDNDVVALTGLYPKPATIDIGAGALGGRAVQELMWKLKYPAGHAEADRICVYIEPRLVSPEDVD